MSTILFLSGLSMNDALGAAGRAHRMLFEELGHSYLEIKLGDPGTQDLLNRTVQDQPIEFAYSVVGMGAAIGGRTADGRDVNFWEANHIPYISLSGDSPAYFFSRHVMPSPWHASLYYFPEHLELRKRLPLTRALYGLVPPVPFDAADKRKIDF